LTDRVLLLLFKLISAVFFWYCLLHHQIHKKVGPKLLGNHGMNYKSNILAQVKRHS